MGEIREERRIVTALFADVAGSTALAERLDLEDIKLVVGEAISRAIRIVESYGGTINNLAGDGLLALFGAPIAHEDDPERAVRAAIEIVSAAKAYGDEVHRAFGVEGFAMRVGIHTGEIVVGQVGAGGRVEYGAIGDAVNIAFRIQSLAATGTVLVSEATKQQVADRFEWNDGRSVELKGKTEAVRVYSAIGTKAETVLVDATGHRPPMVGRTQELSESLGLLDRLRGGRGGLLFIVGEPGIGKSRLTAELRQQAATQGRVAWLDGRCVSYGQALPYWPYRDLLRSWLQVRPTDPEIRVRLALRRRCDEIFGGESLDVFPYLATILGLSIEAESANEFSALSAESLQFRTFEAVSRLFERLAGLQPLVVALDDLHWADPTSLALTHRLLALTERQAILIIVSQRRETDHGSWQLKEMTDREYPHLFHELRLRALGHKAETELLSSLAHGGTLSPDLRERILSYTAGNPFYLEQMVGALIDRGAILRRDGQWVVKPGEPIEVPQTLEGVIIARIDRLEPEWSEVLTAASILGRTFGLELLRSVAAVDMPALEQAVHHLSRLEFFAEEAGQRRVYRFRHALIQEAAERTLVASRRQGLHRRAAEWYESYYQARLERVYGLIAHHWQRAADIDKAAFYLKLAGERALAEWSLDEAIASFRSLFPLMEQSGRRNEAAETLFKVGTTLHLAMRYREANDAWKQAFQNWVDAPAVSVTEPTATVRVAAVRVPWDADPTHPKWGPNSFLHLQLYDCVVRTAGGLFFVPGLAESWEVTDDGLLYDFHLRKRLTWNDGAALTAKDVVSGIRRMLEPTTQSPDAASLFAIANAMEFASGKLTSFDSVGVRAVADDHVQFRLATAAPYFLFVLAWPEISGARPDRLSGPFRLVRMDPERVIIERDPAHRRQGRGNVRLVEWVAMKPTDAQAAFDRGEIDQLTGTTTDLRRRSLLGPLTASVFLAFEGTDAGPDPYIRMAIAHATDRTFIERFLRADESVARGGLVPPGIPGYLPDVVLDFDPDRARQLLARSAHRGPVRLVLLTPRTPSYWADLLASWRDVLGVDIEQVEEPGTPSEKEARLSKVADGFVTGWSASLPDPDYFLGWLLHSQSVANTSHWSDAGLDNLVDHARRLREGPQRLAFFREADRLAVRTLCAVVPLTYQRQATTIQPWVHDYWVWGSPMVSWADITIDQRSPRYRSSSPVRHRPEP